MIGDELSQHQVTPLMDYWHIIRRHKWPILSLTTIFTIVGLFISTTITPTYLASARLLISPETQQNLFSDINPIGNQQTSYFYQTQTEIIRSRSLATEVINELDLVNHQDFLHEKLNFLQNLLQMNEVGAPVKFKKGKISSASDIVVKFKKSMEVTLEKKSEIISVKYEGKDPKMTAKVVNKVIDVYMRRMELAQKESNKETVGWLSENLEIVRNKLVKSEAELELYQSRLRIGDSKDEESIKSGKYGGITERLLSARTKRAELEIRFNQVKNMPRHIKEYQSLQYVMNNQNVRNLKDEKNIVEKKLAELSVRYGHKHPKIISLKAELKAGKNRLNKEIFIVVDSIQKDFRLAILQEREVEKIYAKMQENDRSKKGTRFNLAKLEREVETNKELYNLLLTKLKEADMSSNKGRVNIKIIDKAEIPKSIYKPNRKKIVLIALFIGLFFGIIISFFREFNNKTFKTGESLVEMTHLPLLGVFPILSKKELASSTPERLIIEKPRSTFAESVNNIRTNLMFSCGDEPPQVIMVTSAVASEGKTTVSCNLGIALSRLGPTLVIEADT
ncbi:MAG: hypothetical protein IMY67_08850, partial [Bacteroidetes bacterium]|nr:hypothetical protein [Bacteroidota bacterium]